MAHEHTKIINFIFYNPCWGLLGDWHDHFIGEKSSAGVPSGSYFLDGGSGSSSPFWHFPDQILLRPEIMRLLKPNSLKIIVGVGNKSLLDEKNRPDIELASDHLPLMFEIEISGA